MTASDLQLSFVVVKFHEFYNEVVRLKRLADVPVGEADFDAPQPAAEGAQVSDRTMMVAKRWSPLSVIAERLHLMLEHQALDAGRSGGEFGSTLYRDAEYVMAAVADDIFLNLEWEGRDSWDSYLLEYRLFGTRLAGELIFDRADKLLKEGDAANPELATVYLLALALGFQGKYRGTAHAARLARYRHDLFSVVYHRPPGVGMGDTYLFPDAYAHTLDSQRVDRLPRLTRWLVALAVVAVVYFAGTHLLWRNLTEPIRTSNQEIRALQDSIRVQQDSIGALQLGLSNQVGRDVMGSLADLIAP